MQSWLNQDCFFFASTAHQFDVFRQGDGFDFVGDFRVFDAKNTSFLAFANQIDASHHSVILYERLASPFGHMGMDLKGLPVTGRLYKAISDLKQWGTDDAAGFFELAPWWQTAVAKEVL